MFLTRTYMVLRFMGQLKKKCLASPGNAAFWNLVREAGRKLSLITDKEAEALGGISQYSERQAEEVRFRLFLQLQAR
jgi:ATP-dependent DNA helicase 2 subunit 2